MAFVPVHAFEPAVVRAFARVRGGRLEVVKWAAFVLMLVDHYAVFVAGVVDPVAEFCGALVLPMFAFALAVGCAPLNLEKRADVLLRLLCWGCVAQATSLLVRDMSSVNVLFTFAAGLALDCAFDARERWFRASLVLMGVGLGYFCEFKYPGVLLVLGLLRFARFGNADWLYAVGVSALLLTIPNRSVGALFAPLVIWGLLALRVEFARVPRVFYAAYAAQFALMGALRWAMF